MVRFAGGGHAAAHPGTPVLADELAGAIGRACDQAGLTGVRRAACPLYLAVHGDPELPRVPEHERAAHGADTFAGTVARRGGLSGVARAYTSACVASSTAVADAAALIARGRAERVVVAAGYLVDADQSAVFAAGRALAGDGRVRPFSAGRSGLLLGDAVVTVLVESAAAAAQRRARPLARLAGWGRAGDAYHVCKPRPDGAGLARAITDALRRAGLGPADVGYVNAHGSGSPAGDAAESAALHRAFGDAAESVPVSSTKSVHGQALEAGALLELVLTIAALRAGQLPVNAGYLGPDPDCRLGLVLDRPAPATSAYGLSLTSAFGGANTALLVGTP
ncbi:beta-ketoacyl synthase N-terminal-like domain-containing protein [Streptomyces sp. NBC_01198]|uniref:beta-ketoacyl synthase N-terminal-like domain-containing protein n=1 Tax=Streptomyces sp. NBC_01198 TaxID=2903769 RepID=UPI002E12A86B|nr:beta-ketoacyl-[acyl-carrier-protein] synthase family protein [Streptomyces sp. NBC_01198]